MIGTYGIKLSGLKMESVDFWGISALLGILGDGLCKRMFVLGRCHCGAVLGAKKKKNGISWAKASLEASNVALLSQPSKK